MLIRHVDASPDAIPNKTVYADCPNCGYKNALAVTQTGERTLYHCHAGCSQEDLWRTLTGVAPSNSAPVGPYPHPNTPARSYIRFLWQRSQPSCGTVVETYLNRRGILGIIPPALRHLPDHLHKPTETSWPVMLAAVSDAKGRLRAVHRTYLAPDGQGKAPVQPPRMTLGPVGGFACHLAEAAKELAVAEGIETGLSVQMTTGIPTWAALSAGNLAKMILPPLPLASLVIIAADADVPGVKSAKAAALRWKSEGRRVEIMVPSRPGTDFNDLLMEVSL
jgi:hypothetical protein